MMRSIGALVLLGWVGLVGATVTGSRKCTSSMCITGTHDDSSNTDTYTLTPPDGKSISQSNFGWMAIGFGTQMANSPMVIVWPNSDGSITLSQRMAGGHIMPSVTSSPSRLASLSTSESFSNSSTTSITFTIPSSSDTSNSTDLIWAYSSTNPGSSSGSANIVQHSDMGSTTLALLTPISGSSSSSSSSSSSASGTSSSSAAGSTGSISTQTSDDGNAAGSSGLPNHKALLAHAICGAIAVMILLPIGILIPRLSRGISKSRWWFPAHGALNGLLAGALIIAAFAIAQTKLSDAGSHSNLATVLLIITIVQILLGMLTHTAIKFTPSKFKTRTGRGPVNYLHWVLGIATIAIGFATIYTGLFQQWPTASGTGPAKKGWKTGWAVVVGVFGLLYLAGLALLPKQIKRERELNSLGETNDIDGVDAMRQVPGSANAAKARR